MNKEIFLFPYACTYTSQIRQDSGQPESCGSACVSCRRGHIIVTEVLRSGGAHIVSVITCETVLETGTMLSLARDLEIS